MFGFHISRPPSDFPALYVPPSKTVIACVGSPGVIPECMGPLVGSMLMELGMSVIGTLYEPVVDEDEADTVLTGGRRVKPYRLIVQAVKSDLQPGFAELEAKHSKGTWRLRVHFPKTAYYGEVVHFARETCNVIRFLINSRKHVAMV